MKKNQRGQALVVLLFYMIIAITLTSAAVAVSITNSIATMQEEEGNHALETAESGIDNALLRLLRNRSFTGETFSVAGGSSATTVNGDLTKTIVSTGTVGNVSKIVQVTVSFNNGIMQITSWQEL
jgi:Tfp pilus assembly protein PilX